MPFQFTIRAHEAVQVARLQSELRDESRRLMAESLDAQITRDLDRILREREARSISPPLLLDR